MSEAVQSFEMPLLEDMILFHLTTEELHIITEFNYYKKYAEKCYLRKIEFEKQVNIKDLETRGMYRNIRDEYDTSVSRHHLLVPRYSEIQAKVFKFFKNPWYTLEAHVRFINFCYDIHFNNQKIIELNKELNTVLEEILSLNSQDLEFSRKLSCFNIKKDDIQNKLDECLGIKNKYQKIYDNHLINLRIFRLDL